MRGRPEGDNETGARRFKVLSSAIRSLSTSGGPTGATGAAADNGGTV